MGINIKQRGPGRWFLDVRVWKNGKQYRCRETFQGTRINATERYLQLNAELRCGHPTAASSLKILNFAEALKFYCDKNKDSKSFAKNKYILDKLKTLIGNVPMNSLKDKFGDCLAILKRDKDNRFERPVSVTTINRYITYAKAACNLCKRFGLIEINPLDAYSRSAEHGRDRVLNQDEKQKLLNVLEKEYPYLLPAFQFSQQIPIRKNELVRMRKEHLDLINETIRLPNGTTKNGTGVFLPIPESLRAYFRALPVECEWLFYRKVGGNKRNPEIKYLSLGDFKTAWKEAKRKASIKNYHWHDGRHEAATALIDIGVPERDVREVANWKTANMLERYYHLNSKRAVESVRDKLKIGTLLVHPEQGKVRKSAEFA